VLLRGIDWVQTSDKYCSVLVGTAVATLTRRPFLYHIHCNCVPNRLNRFALNRAKVIVANSHAMKVDFIKALGPEMERIVVVHNGVDSEVPKDGADMREQLGIPTDAEVIGAASRLAANKGQAELITAFGNIADRAPGAWLLIAGDDSIEDGNCGFRSELDALVEHHGVGAQTIFLGFCNDMDAFHRTTDIVVDAAWEEAFGMVVVEPMIYGRPVVGTDAGGIPEIIDDGENGLLVPPNDAEALGKALLSLVVDAGWRAALGHRAREVVVQRFDLGVHTQKVAALLDARGVTP
jgi:glycosyltransferase involved in cell wall biosynthesis